MEAPPTWVTEAEYDFRDSPEEEVFFTGPPFVRADPARGRVLAVLAESHQVGAWTLDGTLLFLVGGPGEGPGEFADIGPMHIETDGSFRVKESRLARYSSYTADGELVGTVAGPPASMGFQGLPISILWMADGSYLGVASISSDLEVGEELGATGYRATRPVTRTPVVRVRDLGDGRWSDPEPLLWLDISNGSHVMRLPGGARARGSQPFGDPDVVRFEPGVAVVMRTKGDPGTMELIEVDASGDSTWHRRLAVTPRRLTPAMVDEASEWVYDRGVREAHERAGLPWNPELLREAFNDRLYRPEYLPVSSFPHVLSVSGEVWVRTSELVDTLRVHYAVPRGDATGFFRRVLVPESLWVSDATETHVWGFQIDSMGRPRIVGRRLVPAEPSSEGR